MSKDLHTYIEPELEARITALVLGEVSEFDVEELEKIIAAQPELQIFRRRIEALHKLLGEAIKQKSDPDWQLSADRRIALGRKFSEKPETKKPSTGLATSFQWRTGIGIAACLLFCVILFSMATPVLMKASRSPQMEYIPEIVSYQSAEGEDVGASGDKPLSLPQPVAAAKAEVTSRSRGESLKVPSLDEIPQIAKLFKTEKTEKTEKERGVLDGVGGVDAEFSLVKRSQSRRQVSRKPSAPSSSMATVIAANNHSNIAMPVPEEDVPDPSVDFGSGDDFGDGWGNGKGGSVGGGEGKDATVVSAGEIDDHVDVDRFEDKAFTVDGSPIAKSKRKRVAEGRRDSGRLTRTNASASHEMKKKVEEVRKSLYMGEGYSNLGKYDEAEKEYKKALSIDKYNKSARRGLEKLAALKSDYYRAAYDQTRAQLLTDVDKAWEIEVPGAQVAATSGKKQKPAKPRTASPERPKPLPEETSTSTQPYSTFSLNVSDVSFKLAKVAMLEKGQWPEVAKVRTEEFVNAFDYGDPSPRRGEPVACAIEQSTHPFIQQRNLLRIGMKTAAMGRSTPLSLTVLLDHSGSMQREDREASVLAAIKVLAAQLGPQDTISLIGFARTPRLLADRLRGDQAAKLVEIVATTPSEGGTNIEEALQLARKVAKRQRTDGTQSRIVLITDGVANLGNTLPENLSGQIEMMRQEGIAFDACGVGAEGLNDEILEAMTRKGDGRYYFLNRPEDADSGFAKQLAGALSPAAKNVKVQVVFNAKRITSYRLLGFEKHRLNKEDFRNDQVDAAEMAAEESGNAVYQIKVDPSGEGEVGEVFVRFLDARTHQMVERSWPITYERQVQPFDLAPPSMQLAGIASQLGEKLHRTDAGTVQFDQIRDTLNKLRYHYRHNANVKDLIRMCKKTTMR